MLYKGADLIRDVEFVIFDEVHYVNDAEVRASNLTRSFFFQNQHLERCRLGGSHNYATGTRQHHPPICNCSKHEGVCGLGRVSAMALGKG